MTTYFVKPNGNNRALGTNISEAWRTIQYAIEHINSGDIIRILPGVYNENIDWRNQGVAPSSEGVILEAHDPKKKPTISGNRVTTYQMRIYDRSHITVKSIRFANYKGAGVLIRAYNKDVTDITFEDCEWYDQQLTTSLVVNNGNTRPVNEFTHNALVFNTRSSQRKMTYVTVRRCSFEKIVTGIYDPPSQGFNQRRTYYNECLTIHGNVNHWLIEECYLDDVSTLGIDVIGTPPTHYDFGLPRYGIIRNNTIKRIRPAINRPGKAIYMDRPGGPILVEGNLTQDDSIAYRPNIEPYRGNSVGHGDIITRNNVFISTGSDTMNTGSGSWGGYEAKSRPLKYIEGHRFAHNVIVNEASGKKYALVWLWCRDTHSRNNVIVHTKRKFLQGAIDPGYSSIVGWDPPPATPDGNNWTSDGNLWWCPTGPEDTAMSWGGRRLYNSYRAYLQGSGQDANSVWGKPIFVDPIRGNYALDSASPGAGVAIPLTQSLNSGTASRTLKVKDARWFCDGWNMVTGDRIKVGDTFATVTNANWETGELNLIESITWQVGDSIYYTHEGQQPSIGLTNTIAGAPIEPPVEPPLPPITTLCKENLLINGDFTNGSAGWEWYTNGTASIKFSDGNAIMYVVDDGGNTQLYQSGFSMIADESYELDFNVYADIEPVSLRVSIHLHNAPYTNLGLDQLIRVDVFKNKIRLTFTATSTTNNARLQFAFTSSSQNIYLDEICLRLAEVGLIPQPLRLIRRGVSPGTVIGTQH